MQSKALMKRKSRSEEELERVNTCNLRMQVRGPMRHAWGQACMVWLGLCGCRGSLRCPYHCVLPLLAHHPTTGWVCSPALPGCAGG